MLLYIFLCTLGVLVSPIPSGNIIPLIRGTSCKRICYCSLISRVFINSSSVTRLSCGKAIWSRTLKWESSSAPAANAQSTNLLSSGSSFINSIWKCGSTSNTFGLFSINKTTFSAIEGVICWPKISWYSSKISFDTHSWYLLARKASHIGRYGLLRAIICSRQLVSITTGLMAYTW